MKSRRFLASYPRRTNNASRHRNQLMEMPVVQTTIQEIIRETRLALSITQDAAAAACRLSKALYVSIELGNTPNPKFSDIVKISRGLDIPLSALAKVVPE